MAENYAPAGNVPLKRIAISLQNDLRMTRVPSIDHSDTPVGILTSGGGLYDNVSDDDTFLICVGDM